MVRDLAAECLALAERRGTAVPLMIGHRLMGTSLLYAGDIVKGRSHLDRAIALYDPREHRQLATRFGHDIRTAALCFRSWALWLLGYPEAALADAERSLEDAREVGQAATLMFSLTVVMVTYVFCGRYAQATALADELVALAEQKDAILWKAFESSIVVVCLLLLVRRPRLFAPSAAGLSASRSTGARYLMPLFSSNLAWALAALGRSDDASRCISEAITTLETTKERSFKAEASRSGRNRAHLA